MTDFSLLKNISEIQDAKEGGVEIFTKDEKLIFITDVQIDGDVDKAREVAELWAKLKKAKKTFKKDTDLHDDIQKQKRDNTLAFKILQSYGEKVSDALAHLELYYNDDGTSGKTEQQLKDQIKVWEVEKIKKEASRGNKWRQKQAVVKERNEKLTSLANRKKSSEKRKILLSVAKWDGITDSSTDKYEVDGVEKKLSGITFDPTKVHNYDGAGLTSDSPPFYTATETFGSLVIKSKGYLSGMDAIKSSKPPRYIKTKIDNAHNQRTWNCKNNIACSTESAGYSFVKVLRDVGIDKINTVIDNSGNSASDVTKLKRIAKDIINCINPDEAITGQKDNEIKGEKFARVHDEWFKKLLTLKLDQYPYKEAPNWEEYFELMKKVFPRSGKPYLDDPGNTNYILPKSGNKGWKGFFINGYAEDLPNPGVGSGKNLFMSKYVKESTGSVPQILKDQVSKPYELKDDLNFKSLVNVWWDTYENFFDSSTLKWKNVNNPNHPGGAGIDVTGDERNFQKLQKCLRFAKTLREVLKEAKITNNIDDLDYVILDVANKAEKVSWINPHDKISENYALTTEAKGSNSRHIELVKAIEAKKVWKDIINYGVSSIIDFGVLSDVIVDDANAISILEEEVRRLGDQISKLSNEETELDIAVSDLEDKILSFTRGLDEFKKDPVDKNKTAFTTLWDQGKDPNKWTRSEILKLLNWIEIIRGKLDADEFTANDYDGKKTILEGIQKKYSPFATTLNYYDGLGETDAERIERIIKEKDETAFTLEKVRDAFDGLSGHVKLEKGEQNSLENIKQAIKDPTKFRKSPSGPSLTKEKLTELFKFDVDDAKKWEKVGNQTLTESKIKDIILNDYGPDNKDGHGKLISHLVENGEGFEGTNKSDYKAGTEDDKKANWEKFMKKGPEVVIKTIVNHEFEDKKGSKRTEMDEKKDNDQPLNKDRYKKGDDGKFTDDAVKLYMYEEKIGENHQFEVKKEEDKGDNNDEGSKKTNGDEKKWYQKWGYMACWLPPLVIIGVLVAIFWKNIAEWWNGPAEEQGEGEIDEGEKGEEER